jgi:hypothetical protein
VRGKSRIPAREIALLLAVVAAPSWLLLRGAPAPVDVFFKLGPNDAAYLAGFERFHEIDGPLAAHWTTTEARIDLPLELRGAALDVRYRLARMLPETAVVDVRLAGRPIDRVRCRGGAWVERSVPVADASGPLRIDLLVDSHDARGKGVRLDWVGARVREGWIRPRGFARFAALVLGLGAFALLRAGGLGLASAGLVAAVPGFLAALGFAENPFATAHLLRVLPLPALGLTAVAALLGRRQAAGRWLAPVALAGYLAKGILVFHPAFFYPDVQNHGRYVRAFSEAEGGVVERGIAAQVKVATAYPRLVAGKAYVFPYSPLFFVPFVALGPEPGPVEDALRHAGLLAAGAEPLAVYGLGLLLLGPAGALASAAVSAALPPIFSRLLYAMWPTLVGHLLDLLAIVAALFWLRRPESGRRLLLLAAAVQAAFLTYIASLFNLGAFLAALALLERRRAKPLLAILLGTALATVLLLYADFTRAFVTEIVPALLTSAGRTAPSAAAGTPGGLLEALARVPLFYGWGYPALAAAGLLLLRRTADTAGRSVVAAYGLAFLTLVLLRGLLPGLFRDLKEITFIAPLVAIGVGGSLLALARRGRAGAWAVVLLAVGLLAFSSERAQFYFEDYRPAYMRAPPR